MDREDIEVLDEFDFDNNDIVDNNVNKTDTKNNELDEKEQLENPVVEIINNKTTMKLIGIMLIVLFIAVFFMPKFFELIGNI